MYTIENLKCLLLLLSGTIAQNGNPKSPCGIPNQEGLCRFIKPCKPTLLPGNDSFMIVSWRGLFEDCHEDQFNKMYVKIKNKKGEPKYQQIEKTSFSKNSTTVSTDVCEDSEIAIRIDFNEGHVNKNPRRQRALITHDINCTASLITTDTKNYTNRKDPNTVILVGSISSGVLIVIVIITTSVVVLRKRQGKIGKMKNKEEKDINPVYGDYYYQDGNRRQNIVEVLFYHIFYVYSNVFRAP